MSSDFRRPAPPTVATLALAIAAAAIAAALTGGDWVAVALAGLVIGALSVAIAGRLGRAPNPPDDTQRSASRPARTSGGATPAPQRPSRATPAVARAVAGPVDDTTGSPVPGESPSPEATPVTVSATVEDLPSPPEPSLRDPVTGLATRALFRDRLTRALLRAQRRRSQVAVFLLEIDVHEAPSIDQEDLLDAVARRLATWLRATDSAARLEGFRFALLLEDLSDAQDFAKAAQRVARLFATPLTVEGQLCPCSAYIGVAVAYPEDDAEQLLQHAGVALRDARTRDRGTVELFDPGRHAGTLAHRNLETEMHGALERGELTLLYQPIVYLRSRRIAGVEALLRWQHRDRGVVPAAAFIPVAEATGLIIPLGRWVLREACRQLREWQDILGPDRPLTLTVNVSARQLDDLRFTADVAAAIEETGIDPHRLVLEISERVLARSSADALWRLREIRGFGVRLAVDGFGARGGSVGDPAEIPVDILKIDRTFVSQVARRAEDHAATRAIVALGRLKQLRTVAPGIEREEQLVELLRFHCEYGQGALFSEPVDAEGMLRLLQRE